MAKWLTAPVRAVKVMMNTLVPTAVFSSYPSTRGEQEQHHHAAAGADKAADKAHDHAADHRLHQPLLGADALHGLLGGHDRPHDELDAQQAAS